MTYNGPRVDCDVHHAWVAERDLIPYLSERWREYMMAMPGPKPSFIPPFRTFPLAEAPYRMDAMFTEAGHTANASYETLRDQLLDRVGITRAVLTFDITGGEGLRNVYLAADVIRALNDWSVDRWLGRDERLYGAILVPAATPDLAVKEIHRLGKHPKMAEVQLYVNPLGLPFGHPVYHPIYEAAAELGLPVAIHAAGDGVGYAQTTAGGLPVSRIEYHALYYQAMMAHLVSFITHGVFEKFPDFRLLIVEVGLAWLPAMIWKLDAHARLMRRESPWVRRAPSDYIRQFVRATTQPIDDAPERRQLLELLEAVDGIEDLLCFSTDFPHYDGDEATYIATRLPSRWLPKIFHGNASQLYRWGRLDDPSRLGRAVAVAG